MCPAQGTMRVAGYEHDGEGPAARRATQIATIAAAPVAA
jgi:hypothetical protein